MFTVPTLSVVERRMEERRGPPGKEAEKWSERNQESGYSEEPARVVVSKGGSTGDCIECCYEQG